MDKERIFMCYWQEFGSSEIHSRIYVGKSIEELFDFFLSEELTSFTFHDITDKPIEDFEREINYLGKYSV